MSRALDISERHMRRLLSGERLISEGIAADIHELKKLPDKPEPPQPVPKPPHLRNIEVIVINRSDILREADRALEIGNSPGDDGA